MGTQHTIHHHMKAHFFRAMAISFFLAVVVMVNPTFTYAQASEGIQISPAVIDDKTNPGDTYHFVLKVTNVAEGERTFYLVAQDIKGLDDKGLPVFAEAGKPTEYELSTWIQMPTNSVTLKAHETREIPFVVKVPGTASPGAHFGGIFLDEHAPKVGANGSGIGFRVGTIIDLKIAGTLLENAQLREFSTGKFVYGTAEVSFSARVANLGNVLLRPHGLVEVTDMFGKKVGTVSVNDQGAPVFPGSDRSFAASWNYDGFAFGRYEAIVSLVYGDEGRKTISSTASFWILPLKPILIVLGILLVAILGFFFGIRSYIKRRLRDMGVTDSTGASSSFAANRHQRSAARMFRIVLTVFVVCIVVLALLFFMFA